MDRDPTAKRPGVCPREVKLKNDTLTRVRLLGSGGSGAVYEVQRQSNGERLAAKVMSKEVLKKPGRNSRFLAEIQIHSRLIHPGIVEFRGYVERDPNVFLIMEKCSGRCLYEEVESKGPLPEHIVANYMSQIISAVRYMHRRNVMHRDLKLKNIILTENNCIKICDFGLAKKILNPSELQRDMCGTPNYIAPEVLNKKYGFEADIWSLGVVLYSLLVGRAPFQTSTVEDTYEKILKGDFTIPDHIGLSMHAKSLIKSILRKNPKDRPSLSEIVNHPFFTRFQTPSTKGKTTKPDLPVQKPIPKFAGASTSAPSSATRTSAHPPQPESAKPGVSTPVKSPIKRAQYNTAAKVAEASARNKRAEDAVKQGKGQNSQIGSGSARKDKGEKVGGWSEVGGEASRKVFKEDDGVVWVVRWVDYSFKYGLGYLLSDGTVGVLFKDRSTIISSVFDHQSVHCRSSRSAEWEIVTIACNGNIPAGWEKKVKIWMHMMKLLTWQKTSKRVQVQESHIVHPGYHKRIAFHRWTPESHIHKWICSKHGNAFVMTDASIQLVFQDGCEAILAPASKFFAYVNEDGGMVSCSGNLCNFREELVRVNNALHLIRKDGIVKG